MKSLPVSEALLYEVASKIVEESVWTIPEDVKNGIRRCIERETDGLSKRSMESFLEKGGLRVEQKGADLQRYGMAPLLCPVR